MVSFTSMYILNIHVIILRVGLRLQFSCLTYRQKRRRIVLRINPGQSQVTFFRAQRRMDWVMPNDQVSRGLLCRFEPDDLDVSYRIISNDITAQYCQILSKSGNNTDEILFINLFGCHRLRESDLAWHWLVEQFETSKIFLDVSYKTYLGLTLS